MVKHNNQIIFWSSDEIKEKEFEKFMKIKAKKSTEENISCKHICYDTVIIWTKEYMFEVLEDKKWKTKMYYLKWVKNI